VPGVAFIAVPIPHVRLGLIKRESKRALADWIRESMRSDMLALLDFLDHSDEFALDPPFDSTD